MALAKIRDSNWSVLEGWATLTGDQSQTANLQRSDISRESTTRARHARELVVIAVNQARHPRSFSGNEYHSLFNAIVDGHAVLATTETAKGAFVKAVEWGVTQPFADVTIGEEPAEHNNDRADSRNVKDQSA